MVIIHKYRLKYNTKKKFFKVISYEEATCPICGGKMVCFGSRRRKMIDEDGSVKWLSIRRLRCLVCKKIHHELPDLLYQYHVICRSVLIKIVSGNTSNVPCSDKMICYIRRILSLKDLVFISVSRVIS